MGSQCTFWCSVLSDVGFTTQKNWLAGLNAPFGAQCFPTRSRTGCLGWCAVSMHLLVLSAFRPKEADTLASTMTCLNAPFGAQCFPTTSYSPSGFCSIVSMHLLVLSAFRLGKAVGKKEREAVSMHLLVLSAFRQNQESSWLAFHSVSMHLLVLSAFRPRGYDQSKAPF